MTVEVRIEHRYPSALALLQHHGPEALAVLHDVLVHAERRSDELVVEATVRQIAQRLDLDDTDIEVATTTSGYQTHPIS